MKRRCAILLHEIGNFNVSIKNYRPGISDLSLDIWITFDLVKHINILAEYKRFLKYGCFFALL